MLSNLRLALLLGSFMSLGCAVPGLAQQGAAPTSLGQFGDWQAFQAGEGASKSCFAASSPKDRQPAHLNRDPANIFITHRPRDKVRNELNIAAGFPMKDGDTASLTVGTARFMLYAKDRGAWVKTPAEEPAILAAMRKGRELTFEAVSKRNNRTTDRYSLIGLTQALDAISRACP